jgi:hypothetical protein
VTLGDLNNHRLGGAVGRKVLCQPLPQETRMGPHDAVFAAVVPRRTMKHMNADLLFRCRFRGSLESALSNVKKKFSQAQRASKLITGNDPVNQSRPGVWI